MLEKLFNTHGRERFVTESKNIFYLYDVFLIIIHILLGVSYLQAYNYIMTGMTVFSIAVYLFCLLLIRKRAFMVCFCLIIAEVNAFTLAAVILLGDASFYSLYSISLIPTICMFYYSQKAIYKKNNNILIVLSFLVSNVCYIAALFIGYFHEPVLSLPPMTESMIGYMNFLVLLIAVGNGSLTLLYNAVMNATKLEQALEETGYAAQHDYLTGLKNRKSMENFIGRLYAGNRSYALIMGDIDKFKDVNDTYGHDCGDYILKIISKLIKESVTKEDRTYRYGGEEIIAIIPDATEEEAYKRAQMIREKIAAYDFEYIGQTIHITMTFGVSTSNGRSFTDVEREADVCLYYGKASGRNCVITSQMMAGFQNRIQE